MLQPYSGGSCRDSWPRGAGLQIAMKGERFKTSNVKFIRYAEHEISSNVAHEFVVASSTVGKDGAITYKLWDAFTKRYYERTVLNQ
eukprot:1142947-Pelagomonas_calceolata.AAC.4